MSPNYDDSSDTIERTENNSLETCKVSRIRDLHKASNFKNNEYTEEKLNNKVWYKRYKLKWSSVSLFSGLFAAGIYSLLTFPFIEKYKTVLWAVCVVSTSTFGVVGGAHRLWSHKSYKAKLPLQIIIACCYMASVEFRIRNWVLLHRVHHKFTETDADPHNIKHGVIYAHIGWILIKRPKEVVDKYKVIDMSDIDENPVIRFCDRYFVLLTAIAIAISIMVPVHFWNEDLYYAVTSQIARIFIHVNIGFAGNSFAHIYGYKPFNKSISAADSGIYSFMSLGEGWHNYHHVFPYDYRTSEIVGLRYDPTAKIIEFFEKIGLAYDLKKPSTSVVKMVIKNKGDHHFQSLVN